jgi:hypothetical protein
MRKFILWAILIFFSAVYIISSNGHIMHWLVGFRKKRESFKPMKEKYGDLYALSYLPQFRISLHKTEIRETCAPGRAAYNLYLLCDSYLQDKVSDSFFCNINKLELVKWEEDPRQITVKLDNRYKNILLIEITERNFRNSFQTATEAELKIKVTTGEKTGRSTVNKPPGFSISYYTDRIVYNLFHPFINQNLEYNLFDYGCFKKMKEWKATLNEQCFGRVNTKVVFSRDKKYLLLKETVDTALNTSSFREIGDAEFNKMVSNLNEVYNYYKKLGFEEVYLSVIPNTVSLLDPGWLGYNELIPRLQADKHVRVPVIDAYTMLKTAGKPVFLTHDSHWNNDALQLWLNEVNKVLQSYK